LKQEDSQGSPIYLEVEGRGAEGTAQVDQTGNTIHYFPAPGPLTRIVEIPASAFREEGGVYVHDSSIPVDIPSEMVWSSVTCALVRPGTSGEEVAFVRSFIVPLTIAGPV
jgi:hypothetical protein